MSIEGVRKRISPSVVLALVVFFAHLVYLMLGLHAFKETGAWLFPPELPFWGSVVVVLAAATTAAACVYVVVADMTAVRLLWVAAVVAAECVNIAWAVEGRMLEMATTRSEAALLALAECLLVLPLMVFGIFPPKSLRATRS